MASINALLVIMALTSATIADSEVKPDTHIININEAKKEDILKNLNGLDYRRVKNIIEYRDKYGKLKSHDDLLEIDGVTQRLVEINKDKISF